MSRNTLLNAAIRRAVRSRIVLASWVRLLQFGFELKIVGREFLPARRPLIFTANHASHFDGLFLSTAVYRLIDDIPTMVAWEGIAHFPASRWLIDAQALPIILADDLAPVESNALALARMLDALDAGCSLALNAEGRRGDALGPFHGGVAVAARQSGAPIIPLTLRGVSGLWTTLPWPDRWHGKVSVQVHRPVLAEDFAHLPAREAITAMTAEVRRRVASALDYEVAGSE